MNQLKRHKELLRSGHQRSGAERRRILGELQRMEETVERVLKAEPERRSPREQRSGNGKSTREEITAAHFAEENRSLFQADIRNYINANLPKLERFVDREIRFRESNGQVEIGSVSPEEVIDEVVVAALSTDERPNGISVERWMYKLAIQATRRLAGQNHESESELHLEQPMRPQNVTGSDEAFLQYHQPGEQVSREDTIADVRAGNPEDLAFNDELIEQLEQSLRGLTVEQRHAFVLLTIEGFTVDEIAQVTEKKPERVREAIAIARQHLARKLPPSNILKQRLLQRSSVA